MTGITRQTVLSAKMDAEIAEFARELGVTRSSAIRMLCGRALGMGLPRLLVDEKTLEVKGLIAARVKHIVDTVLRSELHALVDEVAPPSPAEAPANEEEPEVPAEPPVAPLTGRKRRRR